MAGMSQKIIGKLQSFKLAMSLANYPKPLLYSTDPPVKTQDLPSFSVFMSQSTDVFTNLALEDWLYKNFSFTHHRIILLWKNSPCVVIGRHQNPWVEANMDLLTAAGIPLARRNSGGGTVYHDLGNLNCTFFTPRDKYDRKHNLQIIKRALSDGWDLPIDLSTREDLILGDSFKISGTAAKLGGKNAYHHCTLMINVETHLLHDVLRSQLQWIDSRATTSVPCAVKNLSSVEPSVSVESVLAAVGQMFLSQGDSYHNRGFQMINPTEGWFPGLSKLKDELQSWGWIYGKTPQFTHTISLASIPNLPVTLCMNKGIVESVKVSTGCDSVMESRLQGLVGVKYSEMVTTHAEELLRPKKSPASQQTMRAV